MAKRVENTVDVKWFKDFQWLEIEKVINCQFWM